MLSLRSSTLSKNLQIPDYGSGWNPLKIKPVQYLDCWYPAWAAGGSNTGAGVSVVTTWRDMGPYGQHLTATLGVDSPQLIRRDPDLNGRTSVNFATTDVLRGAERVGSPTGGNKTIFVVWRGGSSVTDCWLFAKGTSDFSEEWIVISFTGSTYYDSGGNSAYVEGGGGHSANTNYVLCVRNNNGSHIVRRNGTQIATRSGGSGVSNTTGDITLGRGRQTTGSMTGRIAEAMCFRTTFTDAECLDVERRLGAYYGITVA